MTTKDELNRSYMERQRLAHAFKIMKADKDRIALIFGAEKPGSIGEAIKHTLLRRGIRVVAPSKEQCDVRSPYLLRDVIEIARADILICSQGRTYLDWIEDQAPFYIEDVINSTLTGSIYAASAFASVTMDDPWRKQICFIGSMAYNKVLNGSAPYCAAKAGLAHFTRCIAWELAPKGFDVFCVHPSNVLGAPMTEDTIQGIMRYRNVSRADAEAYWGAVLPRAAWLTPEDIAEIVSNLLTTVGGGYQSGANIELGGGQR